MTLYKGPEQKNGVVLCFIGILVLEIMPSCWFKVVFYREERLPKSVCTREVAVPRLISGGREGDNTQIILAFRLSSSIPRLNDTSKLLFEE
jgi:hypothetical protein